MRVSHTLLPFVVMALLATPAAARTGAEIKAQFDAGIAAYDAGDYAQAFKLWWELQYEDAAAMRNAATLLRKGQGVAKDPKKAMTLLERAATVSPTAEYDLADMYLKGEAGPPDLASALPLLQAAAAGNHPIAQFQLGEFYETGAPPLVPQNIEVARQLYAAAASHGMPDAAARMAALPPPVPGAEPAQPVMNLLKADPAATPAQLAAPAQAAPKP